MLIVVLILLSSTKKADVNFFQNICNKSLLSDCASALLVCGENSSGDFTCKFRKKIHNFCFEGQLGTGKRKNCYRTVQIRKDKKVKKICCGVNYMLLLRTNGDLVIQLSHFHFMSSFFSFHFNAQKYISLLLEATAMGKYQCSSTFSICFIAFISDNWLDSFNLKFHL